MNSTSNHTSFKCKNIVEDDIMGLIYLWKPNVSLTKSILGNEKTKQNKT